MTSREREREKKKRSENISSLRHEKESGDARAATEADEAIERQDSEEE